MLILAGLASSCCLYLRPRHKMQFIGMAASLQQTWTVARANEARRKDGERPMNLTVHATLVHGQQITCLIDVRPKLELVRICSKRSITMLTTVSSLRRHRTLEEQRTYCFTLLYQHGRNISTCARILDKYTVQITVLSTIWSTSSFLQRTFWTFTHFWRSRTSWECSSRIPFGHHPAGFTSTQNRVESIEVEAMCSFRFRVWCDVPIACISH